MRSFGVCLCCWPVACCSIAPQPSRRRCTCMSPRSVAKVQVRDSSMTRSGVAVNDTTHDVYVVDSGNNRVEEFNATGTTFVG